MKLPHFIPEDHADSLPRIEKSTLLELMDGKFNEHFDNILVIDCRFEYEYDGGHINGAVNYNDKDKLAGELFSAPKSRTALILHCENSAHRAPIMAKYLRHQDRAINVDTYPNLTYPDMYILDGGYSSFFAEHRSFCFPQNYVEMSDKEHEFACERGLGKVKQRSKLNRAQTFAFGEQSPTWRIALRDVVALTTSEIAFLAPHSPQALCPNGHPAVGCFHTKPKCQSFHGALHFIFSVLSLERGV